MHVQERRPPCSTLKGRCADPKGVAVLLRGDHMARLTHGRRGLTSVSVVRQAVREPMQPAPALTRSSVDSSAHWIAGFRAKLPFHGLFCIASSPYSVCLFFFFFFFSFFLST